MMIDTDLLRQHYDLIILMLVPISFGAFWFHKILYKFNEAEKDRKEFLDFKDITREKLSSLEVSIASIKATNDQILMYIQKMMQVK